jgi:predicted secreted hydrolase
MPMPNNTNSYYYSIPHFKTTGTMKINSSIYQISKNPGDSWMDHQWGDFNVQANGWEWFSIRLDNGLIANIFLNIEYKNNSVVGGLANIILPSGEKRFISYKDFKVTRDNYWFDQKLSISYPMTFNITFPELALEIKNIAAFPEQELHGYWEGYCNVNAVYNKQDVAGFSYTEIVYDNQTLKLTAKH